MSESHKNESFKIIFRKKNIYIFSKFNFERKIFTRRIDFEINIIFFKILSWAKIFDIGKTRQYVDVTAVWSSSLNTYFLKEQFFPDGWKISKVWWAILKMASPICCLIPVYILMFQRLFQVLVISIWTLVIIRCQLLSTLLLIYPFFLANKWIFYE